MESGLFLKLANKFKQIVALLPLPPLIFPSKVKGRMLQKF